MLDDVARHLAARCRGPGARMLCMCHEIEALTHDAVLHHSKVLTDDRMEALIGRRRAS